MSKFTDMSTPQLLEIINLKNESISSYDDIQAAREEYISRISREMRAIQPEKKEDRQISFLTDARPSKEVSYQKPVYRKRAIKKESPVAVALCYAGIFFLCINAFLTFIISIVTAVLNFSPIVNVYVFGALFCLCTAVLGWYFFVNGQRIGKLILRALVLANIILCFINSVSGNIVNAAVLVIFLISIEKNNLSC